MATGPPPASAAYTELAALAHARDWILGVHHHSGLWRLEVAAQGGELLARVCSRKGAPACFGDMAGAALALLGRRVR